VGHTGPLSSQSTSTGSWFAPPKLSLFRRRTPPHHPIPHPISFSGSRMRGADQVRTKILHINQRACFSLFLPLNKALYTCRGSRGETSQYPRISCIALAAIELGKVPPAAKVLESICVIWLYYFSLLSRVSFITAKRSLPNVG
jgi:hypothetical protein